MPLLPKQRTPPRLVYCDAPYHPCLTNRCYVLIHFTPSTKLRLTLRLYCAHLSINYCLCITYVRYMSVRCLYFETISSQLSAKDYARVRVMFAIEHLNVNILQTLVFILTKFSYFKRKVDFPLPFMSLITLHKVYKPEPRKKITQETNVLTCWYIGYQGYYLGILLQKYKHILMHTEIS